MHLCMIFLSTYFISSLLSLFLKVNLKLCLKNCEFVVNVEQEK